MNTLLEMRISIGPQDHPGGSTHSRFRALALNEGLQLEPLKVQSAGAPDNLPRILDQITSAHGFWIQDPALLAEPQIRRALETRIENGAIAIAQLSWHMQPGADWFQSLGLEATSVRAMRSGRASSKDSPMLVLLERAEYDFGFRDAALFQGVRQVLLQQANGIGCFQEAQVVLAIPSFAIELLDSRTDFFIEALPRAELPVMASASRANWRGRVIALHAGALHDRYSGPLGHQFPGIEAADNERFARNLLQAVAAGVRPSQIGWAEAYTLISEIETVIARVTHRVLSQCAGSDWFEKCVPEEIRRRCEKRQRDEGAQFPVAAYLELIDYKAIWKDNWSTFEPMLSTYELPASKTRSLHFFQQVNAVRIFAAHATKRYVTGLAAPTMEQMTVLRLAKERVVALAGT